LQEKKIPFYSLNPAAQQGRGTITCQRQEFGHDHVITGRREFAILFAATDCMGIAAWLANRLDQLWRNHRVYSRT
jgi:hypothetical protein